MYKGTNMIILYVQAMETRKAPGPVQGEGGEDTQAWLGQIDGADRWGRQGDVHFLPSDK